MTPGGFSTFEIHKAVEVNIKNSPDSDPAYTGFNYTITGFTSLGMTLKILFDNPDYVSALGLGSDSISVTFWDSNLL